MSPSILLIVGWLLLVPTLYFAWNYAKLVFSRVDREQHKKETYVLALFALLSLGSIVGSGELSEKYERDAIEQIEAKYGKYVNMYQWSDELTDWKFEGADESKQQCRVTDTSLPTNDPVVECVGANGDTSGAPVALTPVGAANTQQGQQTVPSQQGQQAVPSQQ